MSRPRDFYGLTQDEWLEDVVLEAKREAVALAEIIQQGRDGFRVSDVELIHFVRRAAEHLLVAGAKIVQPSSTPAQDWEPSALDDLEAPQAIDGLVEKWQAQGDDLAFFAWFKIK